MSGIGPSYLRPNSGEIALYIASVATVGQLMHIKHIAPMIEETLSDSIVSKIDDSDRNIMAEQKNARALIDLTHQQAQNRCLIF